MLQTIKTSLLGLVAFGIASAGVIPIDLTGQPVGVGTCATAACTPTVSTYTTGTYMDTTFSSVTQAGAPTGSSSPQNVTAGTGSVPFIFNTQGGGNQAYLTANTNNMDTSIVLDLGSYNSTAGNTVINNQSGVFGVDQLWTMLAASGEANNWQGITITLTGVAANGTTAISDAIQLTSGTDYRSTNSLSTLTTDNGTPHAGGTAGNDSIVTYNNTAGTSGGTSYYLDVQEMDLAALGGTNPFLNGYLDTVTITNIAASGGKERMYFDGLTLGAVQPTPEPTTIALLALGICLVAGQKLRHKRNA